MQYTKACATNDLQRGCDGNRLGKGAYTSNINSVNTLKVKNMNMIILTLNSFYIFGTYAALTCWVDRVVIYFSNFVVCDEITLTTAGMPNTPLISQHRIIDI